MGLTSCAVCSRFSVQRGNVWYHEDDGTESCMVDGVQVVNLEMTPGQPVCDFCNGSDVKWRLTTARLMTVFLTANSSQTHNMDEDWAACETCWGMLEGERWDELVERSLGSVPGTSHPDELRGAIIEMHQTIMRNLRGRREVTDADSR